jgi:hypothetical protein
VKLLCLSIFLYAAHRIPRYEAAFTILEACLHFAALGGAKNAAVGTE